MTRAGDDGSTRDAAEDGSLERVLAEFLRAIDRGEAPSRDELLERHPGMAAELAQFLDDREQLERLASPLREPLTRTSLEDRRGGERVRVSGDYELVRVIARGGMGVVYQAHQRSLRRDVALKMIATGRLATGREQRRFRAEAETIATLDHPHIVPIYEVGEHEERPYFTMKLIEGGNLSELMQADPLGPRRAAEIVADVADAVGYAHRRGILHRDLKPANVLVDADGRPYVTDFGLALQLGDGTRLTLSGDVLGTPAYMAPEQASGRRDAVTTASDIYSLGAVLYELLTGKPPFVGATALETIRRARDEEVPRPAQSNSAVPRDLETICLKCLDKDPRGRYASCEELVGDLRAFLADEPIRARRLSARAKLWRWCRRNRRIAVMLGVIAGLVVVAMLASLVAILMGRERTLALVQKRRAEHAERTALVYSSLADARALRFSGEPGRRYQALARLGDACRELSLLELPVDRRDALRTALRDEVIAALQHVDVRHARRWDGMPTSQIEQDPTVQIDADFARIATGTRDGTITVRALEDDSQVAILEGHPIQPYDLLFSPDGHYLAARYGPVEGLQHLRIWEIDSTKIVVDPEEGLASSHLAYDFHPQSRRAAVALEGERVMVFDLTTGARWELGGRASVTRPSILRYRPDGLAMIVVRDDLAVVRDAESGDTLREFRLPSSIYHLAWSPDGRSIAIAGTGPTVRILDAANGEPTAVLEGHEHTSVAVAYDPSGSLVASTSWDATLRLWEPSTGVQLLRVPRGWVNAPPVFSRDGGLLALSVTGTECAYWEVASMKHYRYLHLPRHRVAIHPGGRLAAFWRDDVTFVDLETGGVAGRIPLRGTQSIAFLPDGDMLTSGSKGLFRWPVAPSTSAQGVAFRVGPPRRVIELTNTGPLSVSSDGSRAAVGWSGRVHVVGLADAVDREFLGVKYDATEFAVDSTGSWIAAGTWQGPEAKVWTLPEGRIAWTYPCRRTRVRFTDRHLVLRTGPEYRFFEVGTWRAAGTITRDGTGDTPGDIAGVGELLAVSPTRTTVQLLRLDSGSGISTLTPPAQRGAIDEISFGPDARTLVATGALGAHVWNLGAIRRRLRSLGVDWDAEATDLGEVSEAPPLFVDVLAGEFEDRGEMVLKRYDAALERTPNDLELRLMRAQIRAESGDHAGALEDSDAAARLESGASDPRPLIIRARLRRQRKEYDEAVADLRAAVRREPRRQRRSLVLRELAKVYHAAGNLRDAIATLESVNQRGEHLTTLTEWRQALSPRFATCLSVDEFVDGSKDDAVIDARLARWRVLQLDDVDRALMAYTEGRLAARRALMVEAAARFASALIPEGERSLPLSRLDDALRAVVSETNGEALAGSVLLTRALEHPSAQVRAAATIGAGHLALSGWDALERTRRLAHDAFDRQLGLQWQIHNEDPTKFSLSRHPGALTVTTQEGSVIDHRTSGLKNLFLLTTSFLDDDSEFEIETTITDLAPAERYHQAGLILSNGDDDYLKWVYQFNEGCELTWVREESGRAQQGPFRLGVPLASPLRLSIAKRGKLYTVRANAAGRGEIVRDSVEWTASLPTYVGLLAGNGPTHVEGVEARFDSFSVWSLGTVEGIALEAAVRRRLEDADPAVRQAAAASLRLIREAEPSESSKTVR